jgi:putative peptidoglycan lipid II flippase
MGVLNSHGRFGASAFAPVCLNLSIIALSFMSDFFPNPAIALSVGVVIGGVLQILVQVPSLVRTGGGCAGFGTCLSPVSSESRG